MGVRRTGLLLRRWCDHSLLLLLQVSTLTSGVTQSNRDTVSIDLRSGIVRGFNPHVKFLATPSTTPNVSSHLLQDADWCGREAVLEVSAGSSKSPTLVLDLEYSSPKLWSLHLSDSLNATGYEGGDFTEGHIMNQQWRVYGRGTGMLEDSLDGHRMLALTDGVIRRYYHFRLYVSHHTIEWRYGRQFGGRRGSLEGPALFRLGGEKEEEAEKGKQSNEEDHLYIGLNRIIGGRWRKGSGLCHVTITLLDDLCRSGRHRCDSHAVCKSFKRFHRCSCREGWEGNGRVCTDVDECRLRNGGCVHLCNNTPGSYACSCHQGFEAHPLDPHNCQDVDECSLGNGGCQHTCTNTVGSFSCTCRRGYALSTDGRTCVVSEACSSFSCQQHCLVGAGGEPSCGCREGHVLVRATKCQSTCAVGNGGCQHHCHQTTNGPACTCHSKYLLAADGQSCVPSCAINNGGCERRCHNTATGVRCSCPPGFTLHEDDRSCLDQDECQDRNGGCDHICVNNIGSFECVCPPGYKLRPDERSCQDVNECAVSHTCEQKCTNFPGSYQCSCRDGFELFADSHCGDRDECSNDNGGCEQICINTESSFHCSCHPGYRLHTNGRDCLRRDSCTPFRTPAKAEVSCYHLEDYEYEEKCTVRCERRSTFVVGPNDYYVYTCGSSTGYDWRPVYTAARAGERINSNLQDSNLLACSGQQMTPGYKMLALAKFTTRSDGNHTRLELVSQGLTKVLAAKMTRCPNTCRLKQISEKVYSSSRHKMTSFSGVDVVRTKLELVVYPTPTSKRCRRKCLRRYARQQLKAALQSISKFMAETQIMVSISGQRYEITPQEFQTRRRMKEACPEGYVYVTNKCVACGLGTYHDVKEDVCLVCPAGTYQPLEGQVQCQRCPQVDSSQSSRLLHKTGARNLSECSDACPSGSWSADGFSPCRLCPPGTYQSYMGRINCVPCPEGKSSPAGTISFSQCFSRDELCGKGTYWNADEGSCLKCEVGFYQANVGSSSCIRCPGSSVTDFTGSTSKEDCKRLECGGVVGDLGGVFESPNYPGNYPNNARCTWLVKPTKGRRVLVVIPEIHLSPDQCGDYLVLRKSKSPYSTVTFETCASIDRPLVFTSRSRRLWVHFRSDHNGTAKGFRIQFVTYNEEYHKLIESIVKDNRLYSLYSHIGILKDRELLPRLLEVVAEPIKYYDYVREKDKLFPSSFIRLLTPKVRRFFSYRRRRR